MQVTVPSTRLTVTKTSILNPNDILMNESTRAFDIQIRYGYLFRYTVHKTLQFTVNRLRNLFYFIEGEF